MDVELIFEFTSTPPIERIHSEQFDIVLICQLLQLYFHSQHMKRLIFGI